MRKKQRLARIINPLGITNLIQSYRSRILKQIPIINYHRVMPYNKETFPFDDRLINATPEIFEQHIKYISEHYTTISFASLQDSLTGKASLPKNPIIITFDDGYDDNYLYAFPILQKYNAKATFCLSSGLIEQDFTFWFDKAVFTMKQTDKESIHLDTINYSMELPSSRASKREAIDVLLEKLKRLPNQTKQTALEELHKKYFNPKKPEEKYRSYSKTMTWQQCQILYENGMEIISHTVTHPILTMLTPDELEFEVAESKRTIEKKIGNKVIAMAFTNGGPEDFNDEVINSLKKHGYLFSATYMGGTNSLSQLNPYTLNRLDIEPKDDPHMTPYTLAFPKFWNQT